VSHDLRVLVDGRPLVGERTGIGVHTAEIARRLPAAVTIASHAPIENREGIEGCAFRVDRAINGIVWQQLRLPRIGDADVLWGPHGTLPVAGKLPAVVTLHDFTSLTTPGRHRFKTIASFNLFIGASLERARRVAAVSRMVADEAIRWFGVPPRRIELVPNGVDEFFSPGDGEESDYVLFAGTLEPRKGVDVLLDAWSSIPQPKPRLVLCGSSGWGGVRVDKGIEWTGFVDRTRLRDLYRGAIAFVYPSRYEGFGIPPLEAMACGAPVIATRTGAVPDFATGAALIVEPGDAAGLRDALTRLLRDPSLRRDLRARGPIQARKFGWEPGAGTMMELLNEAAAG
jgi:glycosyltransferase involved in cell wall biosynthesis